MSFRSFIAFSLLSVGPALLGCDTAYLRPKDGALAIHVQPAGGSPHAAPARGSFLLRGIDHAQRARVVPLADAYQTLHVPLPEGSYALEWQPAGDDVVANVGARQFVPGVELPRIVVVVSGQLTLLDVQTTTPSELGADQVAFAGHLPSRLGL